MCMLSPTNRSLLKHETNAEPSSLALGQRLQTMTAQEDNDVLRYFGSLHLVC